MQLTTKIFLAMAAGIVVGVIGNLTIYPADIEHPGFSYWIEASLYYGVFDVLGRIFVASLKLLVVPMVFVSLVCGTAGLGEHGRMGVMALKTVALYLLTTAVAISLAMGVALIVNPGEGIELQAGADFAPAPPPPLKEVLVNIFPSNPISAMAEGELLQVIVFSLLFGIAISRAGDRGARTLESFQAINNVIMEMVMVLMRLAPYGVFCLLAKIFYETGFGLILDLAKYCFTVMAVLLLHALGVYTTLLRVLAGLNPLVFLKRIRPVIMFGFSTASSNATLPVTLETVEEKLGVNNSVASFTVPLGATINMDGTAIMQGVATVFIAQAYQVDIGLSGYLMVVLTATLASIGTAGVPGVGLVTLALVLQQVGLPVEGIALIIGVDRLLDMMRTSVNVTGDSMVSCVVASSENAIDREVFYRDEKGVNTAAG